MVATERYEEAVLHTFLVCTDSLRPSPSDFDFNFHCGDICAVHHGSEGDPQVSSLRGNKVWEPV